LGRDFRRNRVEHKVCAGHPLVVPVRQVHQFFVRNEPEPLRLRIDYRVVSIDAIHQRNVDNSLRADSLGRQNRDRVGSNSFQHSAGNRDFSLLDLIGNFVEAIRNFCSRSFSQVTKIT